MEWVRTEEGLTLEFEGEDPRKQGEWTVRQAIVPAKRPGPLRAPVWVVPFFLLGACLTSVHHKTPLLNWLGVVIIVAAVLLGTRASKPASEEGAFIPPPSPPPRLTSMFTLRLTSEALMLAADGIPVRHVALADVVDVVAGQHLELVHQDGTRTDLLTPEPSFVNEESATALRTHIREMRALTAGYRGS